MKTIRESDLAHNDREASCSHCQKPAEKSALGFWGQFGFRYLCTPCSVLYEKRLI
jgi:hypothetical protein